MKKTGLLFIATLCVSACGGGGGSSPVSTPIATPTVAAIQSIATQRYIASETLRVIGNAAQASRGIVVDQNSIQTAARAVMAGARGGTARITKGIRERSAFTYSSCSRGVESAVIAVSATEKQLSIRWFYDTACIQLARDSYSDILATSSTTASITGTVTYRSLDGTIVDYQTIAATTGGSAGTMVLASDAPSSTSANVASAGVSCTAPNPSISCTAADVTHLSALVQDVGATLNFTLSPISRLGAPWVTSSIVGRVSSYTAPAGTLSLAMATENWVIVGAPSNGGAIFSGTVTDSLFDGAFTANSLTLADAAADATVTVSATSGTILQTDTGKSVATFTLDTSGNGTLTYSNGTTAKIVNWIVLG